MPNRRSFLLGFGSLALAQFLSGCNAQKSALRVLLLRNSIPPQLIGAFRSSKKSDIIFTPEAQLKTLLSLLETWQKKDSSKKKNNFRFPGFNQKPLPVANLMTLGDAWLATAISQKLISPLNTNQLSQWQQLPLPWQEIVQRNEQGLVDKTGKIWGAPYRWGTTMIVYKKEKFKKLGWNPTDWEDLWRQEIRGRISLLNQPREVIGLTLKKLGYSYNTEDIRAIAALKSELVALNKQVKFYSSDHYLEPLILEDTWLAVGWSHEIIPLLSRYRDLEAVVPKSGTALWADVWVQPASNVNSSATSSVEQPNLGPEWIDFCWQSTSAQQISLYTDAVSPMIVAQPLDKLPQAIRDNPLLFINPTILDKSEFIKPLKVSTEKDYQKLWQEIRV